MKLQSHRTATEAGEDRSLYHLSTEFCGCCVSEYLIEDNMYFIVSPKDIVIARERDQDDHISWLLEQELFEVADLCMAQSVRRSGSRPV